MEEEIRKLREQLAQSEAARLQAEAARLQAEAARLQAEAGAIQAQERERQAEAAMLQANLERRRIEKETREVRESVAPSRLLDFVQRADEELFSTLYIEPDSSKTSSGTTTNVNGRYYPLRLRHWADFKSLHEDKFGKLDNAFLDKALFPSKEHVKNTRDDITTEAVADELDLRLFAFAAVERPAARIVNTFLKETNDPKVELMFFRNNAYGLTLHEDAAVPPEGASGDEDSATHAEATDAKATDSEAADADTTQTAQGAKKKGPASKKSSLVSIVGAPDRWGWVYPRHAAGERPQPTTIFVGEYKAAHKLRQKKLRNVLGTPPSEDFFLRVLTKKDKHGKATGTDDDKPSQDRLELPLGSHSVAHVLCQAFHYMVTSGSEYGYIASGEGLIFLRVPENDPRTLYYFLTLFSVPAIRNQEQRRLAVIGTRHPRETAVAYTTSFCLQAIGSQVRSVSWIDKSKALLAQWPNLYEDEQPPAFSRKRSLDARRRRDDDDEGGPGRDRAPRGTSRGSLPLRRSRLSLVTSAQDHEEAGGSSGEGAVTTNAAAFFVPEPVVPTLPYCSQKCLLGLCKGLPFDEACPNVALHRAAPSPKPADAHPLSAEDVCERVLAQLDAHLEDHCQSLDRYGMFGAMGVLFKISLPGYGYTFVAKGVQRADRRVLRKEAGIYQDLAAYQGMLIPVCLGRIDLRRPYPLRSTAVVRHMMLLSWAGFSLSSERKQLPTGVDMEAESERTVRELERAGLWDDDIRESNLTWNEETQRVMQIDFDQASFRRRQERSTSIATAASPASLDTPLETEAPSLPLPETGQKRVMNNDNDGEDGAEAYEMAKRVKVEGDLH